MGTQVCLLLTTLWLDKAGVSPRSPCDGSLVPSVVGPEGRWAGPGGCALRGVGGVPKDSGYFSQEGYYKGACLAPCALRLLSSSVISCPAHTPSMMPPTMM